MGLRSVSQKWDKFYNHVNFIRAGTSSRRLFHNVCKGEISRDFRREVLADSFFA
jgi:hypothetical protein